MVKWLPKPPELAFGDPRRAQIPSLYPTLKAFTMPATITSQFDPRRDCEGARRKGEEITSIKISDSNQISLDSKFSFPVRKSTCSPEEGKR